MQKNTILKSLLEIVVLSTGAMANVPAMAQDAVSKEHAIHIDVQVKFKQANVVFNMDHLAYAGDMPVGMKYMHLLSEHMKKTGATGKIIGVFHGAAAYMTLNDKAYDAARHVTTGNPYKELIANLQKEGVQIEECSVSMKGNHWGNEDLLPGVLVNTGAVGRLIQLVQEGYVQIQP